MSLGLWVSISLSRRKAPQMMRNAGQAALLAPGESKNALTSRWFGSDFGARDVHIHL